MTGRLVSAGVTRRQTQMLLALAALWGGSFLFIKVAVDELGPVALACGRVLLAAAALVVLTRARARLERRWLLLGAINASLPFVLIGFAEVRIGASLAAILNAATPLFSALVAGDPLTRRRITGLMMGIGGVALVVGLAPVDLSGRFLIGAAASLAAALCYAVGTTYVRRSFAGLPPATLALGQQLGAGAVLLPFVALVPPAAPNGGDIAALAALAIPCTAVAYLLYFRLVAQVGPTPTLTVTMLVPVFGVFWAAVFLGEHVGIGTIAGGLIVLASIRLVTGAGGPDTALESAPVPQ
jgi:drug/metabolite transporter (DMT)-like permease